MPLPIRRYYSNTAAQQQLATGVNSSATTITTSGSYATWPTTFPFFAVVDNTLPTMEIVKVTAISGTNATVVRGQNGTSAISHTSGAYFAPAAIAQDLDEANAHTSSPNGVHGITGNVVGDTDHQTLSNKTLDGTTILQSPTLTGTATAAGVHVTGAASVDSGLTVTGTTTTTTMHTTGSSTTDGSGTVSGALTVGGQATFNGNIVDKHALQVNGGSALIYANPNFLASSVPGDGSWKVVDNTNGVLFGNTLFAKGDLVDHRTSDASIGIVTAGLYRWYGLVDVPSLGTNGHIDMAPYYTPSGGSPVIYSDQSGYTTTGGFRMAWHGYLILGAGDKVQCAIAQHSGSTLGVTVVRFGLILDTAS